ncbi:MAG: hypothetical protein WBA76_04560 [Phormidesmis sp.]
MESILIISNLLLVGLTGTYAWLANKNVKQLQAESAYYRSIVEKQLRFTSLPHLYWDLRPAENPRQGLAASSIEAIANGQKNSQSSLASGLTSGLTKGLANASSETLAGGSTPSTISLALDVFNISNVPAYDVHVSLIGAYTEEGVGIATFMRTYVQSRHRKYPLQPDKVGYYGVRNAVRLSLLPTQQEVVLSLPFPLKPVDVYTLVQYRALSGENYYQVCCFSAIDESGTYQANILEPSDIQAMERLHLFDAEDFALPEKEESPYYLADFVDLWNHSISSRLVLETAATPEEVSGKVAYDF